MKTKIVPISTLLVCVALLACGNGPSASDAPAAGAAADDAKGHGYRVTEVVQAGAYTYVNVERDGEPVWAAAPKFDVEVGDHVVLPESMMPMKDWHSSTLERTWDLVYFAGVISKVGAGAAMPPAGHGRPAAEAGDGSFDFSGLTVPDGGKTVAALFAERESLAGKPVVLRGIVVKVSPEIMGKNWVHVRDGSGGPGSNDLTVTTASLPTVGDTVLVHGAVGTDVDFGAGYVFDVIIEDAELTVE